jgi:hypothetical protein
VAAERRLRTEHAAARGAHVHTDDDGEHDRVIHVDVDGYASRVPEARTRAMGQNAVAAQVGRTCSKQLVEVFQHVRSVLLNSGEGSADQG